MWLLVLTSIVLVFSSGVNSQFDLGRLFKTSFTVDNGNVGVNFLGFRGSAGLGGILKGDFSRGLHAEAETPLGLGAGAGIGPTNGPYVYINNSLFNGNSLLKPLNSMKLPFLTGGATNPQAGLPIAQKSGTGQMGGLGGLGGLSGPGGLGGLGGLGGGNFNPTAFLGVLKSFKLPFLGGGTTNPQAGLPIAQRSGTGQFGGMLGNSLKSPLSGIGGNPQVGLPTGQNIGTAFTGSSSNVLPSGLNFGQTSGNSRAPFG